MVIPELFPQIVLCLVDQQGCWVEIVIALNSLYSHSIILINGLNYAKSLNIKRGEDLLTASQE